jgi:hypothetical protein
MLLPFTFAALLGITAAQANAGCGIELLAIARAGGVATEEACQLLNDFEVCVSQTSDSERTELEVELNQRQRQYGQCSEEPMTAAIRTSRNAIDFSGRDFTFHRTTRQSCNLFELRDLVNGFTANISATRTSIEGVETTISEMETADELRDSAIRLAQESITRLEQWQQQQDQSTPCVPYVEYEAANGACIQLNRTCDAYAADIHGAHYERARPTRTSDRVCALVTVCNPNQWELTRSDAFTDRVCRPVTNCSTNTNGATFTATAATATSDATCIRMPGMSQSSPIQAGGCRTLLSVPGAASGFYWVLSAGSARQVYCDMDHAGGGWTMVGRGKGNSLACWRSSSDCDVRYSGAGQHQYTGNTFRMSDGWINGMTYTSIRFQGTNLVQGNQYWAGKDASSNACRYAHWTTARGNCNCASLSPSMAGRRCGVSHSSHKGVGDWPNPNGGLHSGHSSEGWYFKRAASHGGHNSGYCHGSGTNRCDVALWIR